MKSIRWGASVVRLSQVMAAGLLVMAPGAGCGDSDNTEVRDVSSDAPDSSDASGGDTVSDVAPGDTGEVMPDAVGDADTSNPGDTGVPTDTNVTSDSTGDTSDTTSSDTVTPPWTIDLTGAWVLGRPMPLASSDGAGVALGVPVAATSGRAYLPLRLGSGSLVADGQTFTAADEFAHAVIMRVEGGNDGISAPKVMAAVYVDGALNAPELPRIVACDGKVYATVNDAGGQVSRLLELSADLQTVKVAQFEALPNLGTSVRLGAPICGGPGFVVALDAFGGAVFKGPDGKSSQFSAEQTANRTLIVNGAKVFGEDPSAQTVSATGMRIIHMERGAGQKVLYVGEATIERVLGENTTLVPGDQLVYQHDFAVGMGGTIASQGFFGREDITAIAGAANGSFAVVWTDVETVNGTEVVDVVLSVFSATGARLWSKRSGVWAVDAMAFGAENDLRVVGRFRSLEHIGVAVGPVGTEDAFLAVLDGETGERVRHVTRGWASLPTKVVGAPFNTRGSGDCDGGGLDGVVVRSDGVWEVIAAGGVGADAVRCTSEPLQAGGAELVWSGQTGSEAFGAWVGAVSLPDGLDGGTDPSWPTGLGVLGPVRGKVLEKL